MRPLYTDLANALVPHETGNAGLWNDKFCDQWCLNTASHSNPLARWSLQAFQRKEGNVTKTLNPKLAWNGEVTKKLVGCKGLLREAADRLSRLLVAHGQTPLFYKTDWHFVTGLGREHPVENGLAWHHSLGVPYISGSSIKGMVRAWAEYWLDPKPDHDGLRQIFGPRGAEARESSSAGSVIFLDALPTRAVQIVVDVMTPHYGSYYKDPSGNTPPRRLAFADPDTLPCGGPWYDFSVRCATAVSQRPRRHCGRHGLAAGGSRLDRRGCEDGGRIWAHGEGPGCRKGISGKTGRD